MNYRYDAKFEGNILVVGRTECGKASFVQNLAKNKNVWRNKRSDLVIKNTTFKRKGR